jgi:hypothetical protein
MEEKHLVSNRTNKFTWLENKSKCIIIIIIIKNITFNCVLYTEKNKHFERVFHQ